MKEHRTCGGARWLSFHIFLSGSYDLFLTEHLTAMLEDEIKSGRVKRFFFIRYSEGGSHLRLRFLPRRDVSETLIEKHVQETVRRFSRETRVGEDGSIVQQHKYDRAELYFGENIRSLYAELLNEQTSYFGLRLLRANYRNRQQLALTLASALFFLLRGSVENEEDFRRVLRDAESFAAETSEKLGFLIQPASEEFETAMTNALVRALPRIVKALDQDRSAGRIIRLLRRARMSTPAGDFVAIHALHLLCNKLNVSIVEEQRLYNILRHLARTQPSFT